MSEPTLVNLTPMPFAYLTRECEMDDIGETVKATFAKLWAALAQAKTSAAGPPMARYRQTPEGRVMVDLGVPVREDVLASMRAAGLSTGLTTGGLAMRAMHEGAFDTLRDTYGVLIAAIRKTGRAPSEEMWERYYGRPDGDDVSTEVLWPLKPALASFE